MLYIFYYFLVVLRRYRNFNTYNYIDLLFFNIQYNCYVVVELNVIELRKEYIGQIEVYMNYKDGNSKTMFKIKILE